MQLWLPLNSFSTQGAGHDAALSIKTDLQWDRVRLPDTPQSKENFDNRLYVSSEIKHLQYFCEMYKYCRIVMK